MNLYPIFCQVFGEFVKMGFLSEKPALVKTEDQTSENSAPAPITINKKGNPLLTSFPLLDLWIEYLDGFVIQQDDNGINTQRCSQRKPDQVKERDD